MISCRNTKNCFSTQGISTGQVLELNFSRFIIDVDTTKSTIETLRPLCVKTPLNRNAPQAGFL